MGTIAEYNYILRWPKELIDRNFALQFNLNGKKPSSIHVDKGVVWMHLITTQVWELG